jgi:UDP-N-acetylmuramoyl-tripeptide--D-alanyl-D-alanine ligase
MKHFLRNLVASSIAMFARAIIRKYRPKIVMVTGSVGKTSTKDAIAAVLSHSFYIRASEKSYNSEFGVPLTIIGMPNPWQNFAAWANVLGEALALLIFPNHYPKILVLEVGADRPGDLARILKIATPDAVVVTRLPELPVHVEAYATPAAVREEEFAPAYALAPGAPLIVSADDAFALSLAKPLQTELHTYGFAKDAEVRIMGSDLQVTDGRVKGMEGKLQTEGTEHTIIVSGALGRPQLLAPAAAITLGCALGMTIDEAIEGVMTYQPPAGRGRLIAGKHGSLLLDDSYNASPASVEEALASLALIAKHQPGTRRIAALGDMLELGRYSREEHERIGRHSAQSCDVLVAVGTRSRATAEAAKAAGMPEENVNVFDTSSEAAAFLRAFVQAYDAILIKGSQGIRMERVAEALIADPKNAKLLVRQDKEWKRR